MSRALWVNVTVNWHFELNKMPNRNPPPIPCPAHGQGRLPAHAEETGCHKGACPKLATECENEASGQQAANWN